jgi:hypothetical protein
MAGLVLTAWSHRPTDPRLDGLQIKHLIQNDLIRRPIPLPQPVGMLEVDAVAADGEAQLTQRRLVVASCRCSTTRRI